MLQTRQAALSSYAGMQTGKEGTGGRQECGALACPGAGTKASALCYGRRTVLGDSLLSRGEMCGANRLAELDPFSSLNWNQNWKATGFPTGAAKWRLCQLSSQPILTAVSAQVGSHGGRRAWVSGSGSCLPGEAGKRECCVPSSWVCCWD